VTQLQLRYRIDDTPQLVPLRSGEVRVGRGSDNDLVLPDFSVSRRHAVFRLEGGDWYVLDLDSTNGVQINRMPVKKGKLQAGDHLKIGIFELQVEPVEAAPAAKGQAGKAPRAAHERSGAMANATIVRKLSDFSAEMGRDFRMPSISGSVERPLKELREEDTVPPPGEGGSQKFYRYLNRLARDLIHVDTVEEVLKRVMNIAFEALPVDRGLILLGNSIEQVKCELMRVGEKEWVRPEGEVPVSHMILRTVMEEEVGLLTLDAADDQRLMGGESIRIHGIRAAMCAPLWSTGLINGFIQVDTPFHAGSFTEQDLDFLITLANYAAVGVQRIQERRARGRLERYHSPNMLDAVLRQEGDASDHSETRLRNAEVTVMFADLVDFTSFAESASLDKVAELLTGYCSRAVKAIFEEGGTLDKYIGDCVMAFFGAPMKQADHAVRGVRAALRMMKAIDAWNAERRSQGLPAVEVRVAINSGPVLVGDVGTEQRVDYTVLGNTVNVAARLESTVAQPGEITIGEQTAKRLREQDGGAAIELEQMGRFSLKGLQQQVAAFRVLRKDIAPQTTGGPATAAEHRRRA
jgi:adenylate cyclase